MMLSLNYRYSTAATCTHSTLFQSKETTAETALIKILKVYLNAHYHTCEIKDLSSVGMISKNLFIFVDTHDVVLASIGFRIQNKAFTNYMSRFLLARHLIQLRQHPELTRTILGGLGSAAPEKAITSKKLTNIVVHETPVDEARYWKDRFVSLLKTSSVPTQTQCDEVGLAFSYMTSPTDASITALTPTEMVDIVLKEQGTNDYLRAYIFAMSTFTFGIDREGTAYTEPLDKRVVKTKTDQIDQIHTILAQLKSKTSSSSSSIDYFEIQSNKLNKQVKELEASNTPEETKESKSTTQPNNIRKTPPNASLLLTSVGEILNAVGFLHGLSMDELQMDKWNLKHKKEEKISFPNTTKKSVCKALCELSVHQLYDLTKKNKMWQLILKSMSTLTFVKKKLSKNKLDTKYSTLYLILAGLRKDRYPSTIDEWKKTEWHVKITQPLQRLINTSKYECVDARWTSAEYQPALSNLKFHLPVRTSVESRLSREGNTTSTWMKLIDSGRLSGNQVLQNLRSLVLLNFPVDVVKNILVQEVKDSRVTFMQLCKMDSLFTSSIFSTKGVATLLTSINAQHKELKKKNGESKETNENEIINVKGISMSFRDAKGNVTTQLKNKNISTSFSLETCNAYRQMVSDLAMSILDQEATATPSDTTTKCAVVYTHELSENLLRSGVPPVKPKYTDVSMWRGETICLNSMNRGQIHETAPSPSNKEELLVGITWRELPKNDPKTTRVDLDLSVMLYDADMNKLDHCSYSHLTCAGCKHSGDITSAPYSKGGSREDVLISLQKLPPKTRYLALICYNFTNQPLDECCSDASIFIADPSVTGNGPGGLNILAAAAMRCKTKNNLAGIVDLGAATATGLRLRRLVLCDQQLHAVSNNAENTTDALGNQMITCLDASGIRDSPSKPRLSYLAILGSVYLSNTIVVESGGATDSSGSGSSSSAVRRQVTCYTRKDNEKKSTFFQRIWTDVQQMDPVVVPSYEYMEHVNEGDFLMVLGGELEVGDVTSIVRENETLLRNESKKIGGALCVCNIRSNQEVLETSTIEQSTVYIASSNTGDVLNSLLSLVEKCVVKRKEEMSTAV